MRESLSAEQELQQRLEFREGQWRHLPGFGEAEGGNAKGIFAQAQDQPFLAIPKIHFAGLLLERCCLEGMHAMERCYLL